MAQSGKVLAAGVMCVAPGGRLLFMRRSAMVTEPGTWAAPGGAIDRGEQPHDAAVRELYEEAGYGGDLILHPPFIGQFGATTYFTFPAQVPFEFEPRLNWESDDAGWFSRAPSPMHLGTREFLRVARPYLRALVIP